MPLFDTHLDERSPIEHTLRLERDATLPPVRVQVNDELNKVDLVGGTVTFTMKDAAGVTKVAAAAAVLETPTTDGIVRYDWGATDTDTDGIFFAQFTITVGSRKYIVPDGSSEILRIVVGQFDAPGVPPPPSTIIHASLHILGGSDEIDGDKLGIDFVPTNYTRDTSPSEVSDVKHLTAHLAGIDNALLTVGNAVPTLSNKAMGASVTTSDGDQATTATVTNTPLQDGYIIVDVNGVAVEVGDGIKTKDCYFSGDSGTTARLIKDIVATDTLHWNGSVTGFQLGVSDRIDFHYDV